MKPFLLQRLGLACVLCFMQFPAQAALAVLAFELNDLTLLPNTPTEQERTRLAGRILVEQLQQAGQTVIEVPTALQDEANRGFGYLYEHPEQAAALGKQLNAQQIVVGRLHKPSFLFAYLKLRVVDVATGRVQAELLQEAKGESLLTTRKAVEKLAASVHELLALSPTTSVTPPALTTASKASTASSYRLITKKPFELVVEDLLFAISQHNFRLTEHAKIGQAIAEREQIVFPRVAVLHFCNLRYAQQLLEQQPDTMLQMPCRIALREQGGEVIIEVSLLAESAALSTLAAEVNQVLKDIVKQGAT